MKLKIYGERNTGTQFMREILRLNAPHALWPGTIAELGLRDRVAREERDDRPAPDRILLREALIDDIFAASGDQTLGWKHGAPDRPLLRRAGSDTVFVVTVKNPYAWAASMHRRPHHNLLVGNTGSLEDFVTSPWVACGRDKVQRYVPSVVELWNLKYRAWLAMGEDVRSIVIRYEDLLQGASTLRRLAQAVGASTAQDWRLPTAVQNNPGNLATYRDFYTSERWREVLSDACVEAIRARLDPALVERLGYAGSGG